ncbi:MAG: SUMF1/EgtB/PvdO family nonheme iron enzyme [Kiritimatiellae bacterium]|nr:SUMF1/EgtB/PvdO family nonheme iron enzyme [Kiritimatiellia bacterium]
MKTSVLLFATLTAAAAFAVPVAENVTFYQDNVNTVTITYTLTETPAIVTLDIQTNVTGDVWASIGNDNIVPGLMSSSEANCKVSGSGTHTITWRPCRSWPADDPEGNLPAGKIRAVVTAWAMDNPPDYMVVNIAANANPNTWRYYPDADSVPGGVTNNTAYRQTALLMRKILAKDVTWTMGSVAEDGRGTNETSRVVALTNDYYMAVFETTQEQWRQVMGDWPWVGTEGSYTQTNALYRAMRPAQNISYNEIRTSGTYDSYNVGNEYPNPPHGNSFLGKLKTRTGIDFDLPSEAQWEFACRAGNGEGYWGDGSIYMGSTIPGRHIDNGGRGGSDGNCGPETGPAICGSYAPNSWGLYDMHGNVAELCIDWYQVLVPANIGANPNIDISNPAYCFDGTTTFTGSYKPKTKRGGSFAHGAYNARSAARNADSVSTRYLNFGCRVICPFER